MRHTILLLATSPRARGRGAFAEEASAIDSELKRSSCRECFVLETRWLSEPLDLLRALRELKPTVVHVSAGCHRTGMWIPAAMGDAQLVPSAAIAQAFEAAGESVRLIVLSACDGTMSAEELLLHVDCVVGISSSIDDRRARSFVIGFYGALGEHESVATAYEHGNAAISLTSSSDVQRAQLWVRRGTDPSRVIPVPVPSLRTSSPDTAKRERRRRRALPIAAFATLLLMFALVTWQPKNRQDAATAAIAPFREGTKRAMDRRLTSPGEPGSIYRAVDPMRGADARGDTKRPDHLFAAAKITQIDEEIPWVSKYHQGIVAERADDLAGAERAQRAAIEDVEELRARAPLASRPWFLWDRRQPYDALFSLLVRQNDRVGALAVAEQLHARTWTDMLATSGALRVRPMFGRAPAVEPLSTDSLLAFAGNREVLIYVEVRDTWWRIHLKNGAVSELVQLPSGVAALLPRWISNPDQADLAEQLGTALVPADVAASDEPLYIVAPAALRLLPFPALRRSQRYLVDDRPVVRLSGLAELRCDPRPASVGAPVFIGDAKGDLPNARREVEEAARELGGHAYVGAEATREQLFRAKNSALLHVANHGDADGLTFANGHVEAGDIRLADIAPNVVVLASCGTAASRDPEGLSSIVSAFLAAGTRTVVAAARPVADGATQALIHDFYAANGDVHPAAALAKAQRAMAWNRKLPVRDWALLEVWGHAEPSDCGAPPTR